MAVHGYKPESRTGDYRIDHFQIELQQASMEVEMTSGDPTTSDVATLIIDGQTYQLPIIEGSEGERAVDVSNLRANTGLITLDPGYANTGSTLSGITFIDGERIP